MKTLQAYRFFKTVINPYCLLLLIMVSLLVSSGTKAIASFPKKQLMGDSKAIGCAAYSPNGKSLATGSDDGSIIIWDMASGTVESKLNGHSGAVGCVTFSPNGETLASGSADSAIFLWDWDSRVIKAKFQGYSAPISKIFLLPDGETMVSLSTDANINFRNLISKKSTTKLTQVKPAKYYIDIAISPDGNTLAIVPLGGPIIIWDLEKDTYITTLKKYLHDVFSLEFSPDGQTLAIGLGNQFVVFLDLASEAITTNLWGDVSSEDIVDIAFSPDGKTLATVSRNQAVGSDTESIVLWDIPSKKIITVLNDYTDESNCLTFSPDGDSLASISSKGTVNVWQLNE